MPKIIVTSRYLKNNKNLKNYVKYIATREGAVQVVNATENYIGYLANRPGAVKDSSHALFSQEDKPIDLNAVAKEIATHKGFVWTHVVSLKREDAQRTGYDNLNAWRDLIKRQIPNIAICQKIDLKNIKWYAAFHDKKNNPHVHIVVYSTDEREGYLTNRGIEKIRSGFANDIYSDELHHLYGQQTNIRNRIKEQSSELMRNLAKSISFDDCNEELAKHIQRLVYQLSLSKGKKVYGYLNRETKNIVDEIFRILSENDIISQRYSVWCEMEQQKHDVYSSAKVNFPPLVDNLNFKSLKNMIIQTVLEHNADLESITEVAKGKYEISQSDMENLAFKLLVNVSRMIENDYLNKNNHKIFRADSKLTKTIRLKKQAIGIKEPT